MPEPAIRSQNPFPLPKSAARPSPAVATDVQHRDILLVVLLSAVTLFIGYPFYLWYQWARELNGLARRVKYPPALVLMLSILTLGLAGLVCESLFAIDLERELRSHGRTAAVPNLLVWVTALNAVAVVASFTVIGIVIAIPCGMAATCLLQAELNKLAQSQPGWASRG